MTATAIIRVMDLEQRESPGQSIELPSNQVSDDPTRVLHWSIELRIYARESRQIAQMAKRLRETADSLENIRPGQLVPPAEGILGMPFEAHDPESGWRGRWKVDAAAPETVRALPVDNGLRSPAGEGTDRPPNHEQNDALPGR